MVYKILIITLFLFSALPVKSANMFDIVINEIAWMGTDVSANDEWIELYNNTNQDINLKNWGIYEQNGQVLIEPLSKIIKASSYYLIERTDETTVPYIKSDQEPSGWKGYGLNNKGEYLKLIDNQANLIDEINCSAKWFSGNNKTKQTMERINPLISGNDSSNWQNSKDSLGTPKAKNSSGAPKEKNKDAEVNSLPIKEDKSLSSLLTNTKSDKEAINKSFSAGLTALVLALISGAVILIIKRKIES